LSRVAEPLDYVINACSVPLNSCGNQALRNVYQNKRLVKGTLTRDYRPLLIFIKQLPLGP
jgi:hypothetical protein